MKQANIIPMGELQEKRNSIANTLELHLAWTYQITMLRTTQ